MSKLLLVEDEKDFAVAVRDWLVSQGYLVDLAHSGPEAIASARALQYDLIILDVNLPGLSGIDVCRSLRLHGGREPVLMLTGNRGIDDKELGFDSGADDYLTKPFNMRELGMRVKALLRRGSGSAEANCLSIRDITVYPDEHRVTRAGIEVSLLRKEFALLVFFMRNPGKVFSAETLIARVWATDEEASPDTIRSYITRLRQKLQSDHEQPLIVTVHGVGYKLEP